MLEKHLVLWRPGGSIAELGTRWRPSLAPLARVVDAMVHVTEEPPPRLAVVPFRRDPIALVSVRGDVAALAEARAIVRSLPGRVEGWRVAESVPVARPAHEPAQATLLTLFRKSPRLDRDAFFREWFGKHTPMSLEIHPLTGYVRNVVEDVLIEGSARWDGIVTEDFAERAHLTSARHLFGGARRMVPNMIRVGLHVSHFLDMRTIETYLVTEHAL